MITVTVLGCDGSHAGAGGAGSGYLVRDWSTGTVLWLDAGPGTFANLQRFVDPTTLDAVVLTHEHLDHCSDVLSLATAARWTWPERRDPVPVLAPPGVRARLRPDADPSTAGLSAADGALEWHEVGDGDSRRVGGLQVTFSRTDHGPVTLAIRLGGERVSLGYSADSGPGWPLGALGPDLDLALCEATFTREHEGTVDHMSGRQAGETARRAGVRRLVITHRWPTMSAGAVRAEAEEAFGGPVDQAAVGRGFSL
jgi:ribonuclease BN (tRNA processing enzyme)